MINPYAKKKLEKIIKKHKLVEALVWNKRTGNLVGGHQRLAIVDAFEGSQDYSLDMATIDVPLRQEKALNIELNNYTAQGEFDPELLRELLASDDFAMADVELTPFDLASIAPGIDTAALDDATAAIVADTVKSEEKLRELQEHRRSEQAKGSAKRDLEFTTTLIFASRERAEQFATLLGLDPAAKVLDGEAVLDAIDGETYDE